MTAARPRYTPGPDHPITIEPSPVHTVVRVGSIVIAETDRALELAEASYPIVRYVPIDDVDGRFLRASDQHTYCPFKGEASYFDIVDAGGHELEGAVWYYDDPFPAVSAIRGHVAFYADRVDIDTSPTTGAVQ